MNPTVIVLTGQAGSGKTTAASYFQKKKFPVVRMGDLTDKFLEESHLNYNEKNEKYIREKLRVKYGKDIYAQKIIPNVLNHLKSNNVVVIDGMRNREEMALFRKLLPNPKYIFLEASKEIRYKRLHKRKKRPLTLTEAKQRDESEQKYFKLTKLIKDTDFIIQNQGKKSDLFCNLREIITKIL